MYVRVIWKRAPRRVGHLNRIGESCLVEAREAKALEKGGWLNILPEPKAKKPIPKKAQTRPAIRDEENS